MGRGKRTCGAGDGDGGQSKNGHDGELHFEFGGGVYKMFFVVDVEKRENRKMKEAIEKVDRRQESRR